MVVFDEMAQREEIGALGQRLYNQLLFIIASSGSITSSTIGIVTGVRKHLCDTCRKFKFPFRAVLYSVLTHTEQDPFKLFGSSIFVYGVRQIPS